MENLKPTVTERRQQTRSDIYRYIFHSPEPVSKQQIARTLDISLPTVYQNLTELEQAGLVKIGKVNKSTGGRPPAAYIAVSDIKFALGVSISANHIRILVSDLKQNILAYDQIKLESVTLENVILQLDDGIKHFLANNHLDSSRLLGVGVTIPGIFDTDTGELLLSPTIRLDHFSIREIKKRVPYPLYFENDSTSGGNAEYLSRTPEEQKQNFVYLFLEYGVGGAIFINGGPYYGTAHRSAEFGHMCIEPQGRVCNCGKKGCLEAYFGAYRFSKDLGITIEEFFGELRNGNKEYGILWDDALYHLAIAVNNIRTIFNCDVILGGFMCEYLEPYLPRLRDMVSKLDTFGDDAGYLKMGKYPRRAVMLGVAWNYTNQFVLSI